MPRGDGSKRGLVDRSLSLVCDLREDDSSHIIVYKAHSVKGS